MLKDTIEFIAALFYRVVLFFCKSKPRCIVLYYHSLSREDKKTFERQMAYLARKCRVVKPSEMLNYDQLNNKFSAVCITFDDAFKSVYENAFPVLKKYNLNAGLFVPTGALSKKISWQLEDGCTDGDQLVMEPAQICKLDQDNWEIFSHTVSHPHLTRIGITDVNRELKGSKDELETMLGHKIIGLSYPYGEHNELVRRAALDAGYRLGFTVAPELNYCSQNKMSIGRFSVSGKDSLFKFKLKASGAYEVSKYLRSAKRKLKSYNNSRRVALNGI